MARRRLEIEILDQRKGSGFKDSERAASTWGEKLGGFAKTAAIGLAGVGVAGVAMGISFVKAAEESAKVTAQTGAVLKSMGNVAGVTATQVADLSEKLALKTGVDDELIQSGQNVLLTFGKVRNEAGAGNDIFTRATQSALDMSVALGTDLSAANIQLGKALNDPIKGITAMTRAGVSFSEQQKEQIKTLVESGDTLGAQKIIMAEMEKQFGGSAEAQATASGKLAVVWGNLQETLGEKLLPVAELFSAWMANEGVPWIEDRLVPAVRNVASWMGDNLVPAIGKVVSFLVGDLMPALQDFGEWMVEHRPVLIGVAGAVGGVLVAAFLAWAVSAGIAAIATIAAMAPLILIGAAVGLLAALVVIHFDTIKRWISNVWTWVKDNWPLLLAILTGPFGLAVAVIVSHWDKIKAGATAAKDWVVEKFGQLVSFVAELPGKIARGASGLWDGLLNGMVRVINTAIGWINELIRAYNRLPGVGNVGTIGKIGGSKLGQMAPKPGSGGGRGGPVRAMATGGIVRHRPGGILATIGEGRHDEAVIPLDGRQGLGTTINLTVNVAGSVNGVDDLYGTISTGLENGRINVRGRRL